MGRKLGSKDLKPRVRRKRADLPQPALVSSAQAGESEKPKPEEPVCAPLGV